MVYVSAELDAARTAAAKMGFYVPAPADPMAWANDEERWIVDSTGVTLTFSEWLERRGSRPVGPPNRRVR